MSEKNRDILRPVIEKESVAFAVSAIDNDEIDSINILQASFKAMHIAIEKLTITPEFLLIDGNRFKPYPGIKHECIIKGDGIYAAIAAASILAKTYRDEYMQRLHEEFSCYAWNRNKGYGTAAHRIAIEQHGICKYHRKSFNIQSSGISLF